MIINRLYTDAKVHIITLPLKDPNLACISLLLCLCYVGEGILLEFRACKRLTKVPKQPLA